LSGDAAGFVDALSGDGISFAILSGTLAAEAAHRALTHGSASKAGRIYTDLVRKKIVPELRAALVLGVILLVFRPIMRRLKPHFSQLLVQRHFEVIAGRSSYRKLLRGTLLRVPVFFLRSLIGV
jgi:flavin-dependent dehydrogenase